MATRTITLGSGNDRLYLPGNGRTNYIINTGDGNDSVITNGLGGDYTVFVNVSFGDVEHVYSASLDPSRPIRGWVLDESQFNFLGYHHYNGGAGAHFRISLVDMDFFMETGVYQMERAHVHGRVDFHGRGDEDRPMLLKAFDPGPQEVGMAASEGDYDVWGVKTETVFRDTQDGEGFVFYPSDFTVRGRTITPDEAHRPPTQAELATDRQTITFQDLEMVPGYAYRLEIPTNTYAAKVAAVEDMVFDRWAPAGIFDYEV